jgi:glycosyltransferase involved in cell wall biosynthesis
VQDGTLAALQMAQTDVLPGSDPATVHDEAGAPDLSVVVTVLNEAETIEELYRRTVAALEPLERPFEVIVVDDGSTDETPAVVEQAGARLVAQPARGPNAARNAGARAAEGDLVVFVDDDIDAPPGWLGAIVEGARRHSDAEAFGGPIRARLEGPAPRSCGREAAPITTLDLGSDDRDADFVWGANMAVRRTALERVGEFDEDLPQFGEEEEWLTRLRAAGGRVVYLADARVDHRREAGDARLRALMRGAYVRGHSLRRHDVRRGEPPTLGQELRVLAGCGWHTVRRLCPQGLVMGAHSLGRVAATLRRP